MKRLALTLSALSLFCVPALAGTVRPIVTVNGVVQYNLTTTIPDADLARLVAFAKATYGEVVQTPAVLDANGNITTPAVMRDRTNAEAFDVWWRGVLAGTKANIENYEKALGQQAVTVSPVTVGVPQ